jgi:biopolymer transport protein TolR
MPSLVNRGRGRRTINEINMVPFIDVMLVLLIIFMVTAPLIAPSMIDLPSVETLTLKVQDQSTPIVMKDLVRSVKAAQATPLKSPKPGATAAAPATVSANTAVVISADKNVKYESVVKVMDTLQRAGVQRVGLSVQLAS